MQELLFNINQNLELLYWLGVLFWSVITIFITRYFIRTNTDLSWEPSPVIIIGIVVSVFWPISIPLLLIILFINILVYA